MQDEILEDEVALGGTPAGRATNEAGCEPAATCSFLIHDTRNDAIRGSWQICKRRFIRR